MTAILEQVSVLVDYTIQWTTMFVELIVAEPLLLIFCVLAFVDIGINLIRRLLHL